MRRISFWFWTALGLLATVISIALANVLASRFAPRFDVTATGEHRLSPRAEAVLAKLPGAAKLVIAADFHRSSPEAFRDTTDVLERFTSSGKLELAMIDLGSPMGPGQYQQILNDLIARDRDEIFSQAATIRAGVASASEVAAWAQTSLSRSLDELRGVLSGSSSAVQQARGVLEQRAAGARITGRDLATAIAKVEEPLSSKIGEIELPSTDKAADLLRKEIRTASDQLGQIVGELKRLAKQTDLGDVFATRATAVADQISLQRDRLGVLSESVARLARPGVLRIASALRQAATAIIVPPKGDKLGAISLNELFPAQEIVISAGARADSRRRVEEVLTAALASTLVDQPPIAVFMHAEERPYILDAPFLGRVRENLLMKGIDIVEWAVLLEGEPSGLVRLDPSRSRPAVFIVLPPDSSMTARSGEQRGGIERSQRLGAALEQLAAGGQNILLSLNPPFQRTYGETDPISAPLKRFAISVSGKPVFTERFVEGKRDLETDRVVIARSEGSQVEGLAGALRGLPTYLPWPIGMNTDAKSAEAAFVRNTPLLEIGADDNSWGESAWLRVWQTPRARRSTLPDLPKFDGVSDERGPWTVAIASERSEPGNGQKQRMVVVGSNGWFFDQLTQPAAQVDGRVVAPFPGNQELFDSSLYWLSFSDDLIAQSPQSTAIPLIGHIDPARLLGLRLLLILGLPLCVLALGVIHRAVFG